MARSWGMPMNATYTGEGHPDTLAEILALQSQFEVFRFLKKTAELFGFRNFLVLRLPVSTSLDLHANSIITNWPAEFLGAYDRQGLLQTSAVIARLRKSVLPFCFDFAEMARERPADTSAKALKLYEEFGFRRGACIPVHDTKGGRSAVIMAGERAPLSQNELIELTMIAIHAYQRLTDVTGVADKPDQTLTEREIDCLTWTAAGKTSADIAQILTLSEHTVNHYLNRAAKKLDTVNRTQAVAKALRRGLIS
jgi:LuxR family transcriptional regulator, quorum-sensing system regulator BjaR1